MLTQEIMITPVITIEETDTILTAANKYKDHKVGSIVITHQHHAIGIITERDLIERALCTQHNPKTTPAHTIMSQPLITIHPLDNLDKAIHLMKTHKIKKLPVVKDNTLIGIITITDIAHARPDLSERFMESWIKPRW
ncbi:MAG: CBS domain-containing protein [Candidatus Thermoplasmatota archaeon]|nr:CBS domain-containing protein [Candidatus Thermoplasmatota archaeon]